VRIAREGTRSARTFWWDRARPIDADGRPLHAVIFDIDALAEIEPDGDLAPRAGVIDLVMSLFVAGVWVGVVSTGRRVWVDKLVRQLVGDGLVETIVTGDDVAGRQPDSELYTLALWELGIAPENALAVTGSAPGLRAATVAGLATVVVCGDFGDGVPALSGFQCFGPAEVRSTFEGADPLLADGCRRLHRQWWIARKRAA
jgi:beta-phosphoglucomutase-like phosphatase (HAD superfamily)